MFKLALLFWAIFLFYPCRNRNVKRTHCLRCIIILIYCHINLSSLPWHNMCCHPQTKRPAIAPGRRRCRPCCLTKTHLMAILCFISRLSLTLGWLLRERARQLTLSRESRNKPEEKSSPQTHNTDWVRLHSRRGVEALCWITVPAFENDEKAV